MGAAMVLFFGCWLVILGGALTNHLQSYRFLKGRPVPVRGPRLVLERLRRPLPDVAGRTGNYRGMVWHGMPHGLACQLPGAVAVGSCTPDGDGTLYDARFPASVLVSGGGAVAGFAVMGAAMFSATPRFEWVHLLVPGVILFIAGIGWLNVRAARRAAREMVWHLDGLLAELAEPPAEQC